MDPQPAPAAQTQRRRYVELAHRICIIDAGRIAVRPSPGALIPPLAGLLLGAACFAMIIADIVRWRGALPFPLLAGCLFGALILIPLSGMGLIYGAIGSNVLIDRRKQSVTMQQGLLGLGVGTQELVPFWKIEAIVVEEEGLDEGRRTEEFAQWQIVLLKKSGGRLTLGRVSALRSQAEPSLARAVDVGQAIATLTGAPLQVTATASSAATEPEAR
jgi:hypothetical protein